MTDCSHGEKFSSGVQLESPQVKLVPVTPHPLHVTPCENGVRIIFVASVKY